MVKNTEIRVVRRKPLYDTVMAPQALPQIRMHSRPSRHGQTRHTSKAYLGAFKDKNASCPLDLAVISRNASHLFFCICPRLLLFALSLPELHDVDHGVQEWAHPFFRV